MTLEEAQKIGKVIAHADGGCYSCVQGMCARMNQEFPEFKWTFDQKATVPEPEGLYDGSLSSEEEDAYYAARYEVKVKVTPRESGTQK